MFLVSKSQGLFLALFFCFQKKLYKKNDKKCFLLIQYFSLQEIFYILFTENTSVQLTKIVLQRDK